MYVSMYIFYARMWVCWQSPRFCAVPTLSRFTTLGIAFLVVFTLSGLCLGWTTIFWQRAGCLATLVLLAASTAMGKDL